MLQIDGVPPLLAYLRDGTRQAHARTEALAPLLCLMSPSLTRAEYGAALTGLYRFQAGLHACLPARLRLLGVNFVLDRAPLAALRNDLAWLGLRTPARGGPGLALGGGEAALGAVYVLEGSALGGRVIGRHVASVLGVGAGQGGDFFCGVAADAARERWRDFCAMLANIPQRAAPLVLSGALAAFAALESVFAPPVGQNAARVAERPGATTLPVMNSL